MSEKIAYDKRYVLSSANHVLKLIEILMVRDNIDLNTITKLSGLNKTSVFKLLYTLEYRGFVHKDENLRYHLGERLFSAAKTASSRQSLLDVVNPYLMNLWANTEQSVTLCTLSRSGRIVFLATKMEKNQTAIIARTGADFDAYTNSAGKVLLANSHPDTQKDILDLIVMSRKAKNTLTSKEELFQQLQEYRGESIVLCKEESLDGYGDIASPIYDADGNCIACLNLVFHLSQSEQKIRFFMQQLHNATQQISQKMGYQSLF